MKRIFFYQLSLFAFAIVFFSCSNEPVEVVKTKHQNGSPEMVEYKDQDSNVVKSIEYYKNGQKKMEGSYKDSLRTGEWLCWYENGKLWSRGTFIKGKSEGRFLSYNEDGSLFQESMYKEGKPDGKWCYYKDEKRIKEVYYKNGIIINEIDL